MVRKCGTIQAQKSFNRSSRSQVKYLNLVDDEDGVLRVGGRVGKSSMECHTKFPVVLPSKDVVIERIMWFVHKKDGHQGLDHTHTQLCLKWWIIKGRQQVKSMTAKCMICKRLKSRPGSQMMSDLPMFRLNIAQVFADTGVDLCVPFKVKSGRQGVKVWVVIYTCLRV